MTVDCLNIASVYGWLFSCH